MKSQICYNPASLIPLTGDDDVTKVTEDLWLVKALGFDGIHLWVGPHLLFNRTFSVHKFHPVAFKAYQQILAFAYDHDLEVTAKVPLWNLPWWYDATEGIRNPTELRFLKEDSSIYAEMIVRMMEVMPTIKTWTIGNEPQINGTLYGEKPGLKQPHHTPTDLVEIITLIINLVHEHDRKPFRVELLGPALEPLGVSRFGLLEPGDFLELLWPRISRYCVGMSINSYPPVLDGKRIWGPDYFRVYRELMYRFPDVKFVPSEQGVHMNWTANEFWRLRELVQVSMTTFNLFSYFILYVPTIGNSFSLVTPDGYNQRRMAALEKMLKNNQN